MSERPGFQYCCIVHAKQKNLGKARGEWGKLGGKKRFPSQSNSNEEKHMADEEILQSPELKKKKNAVRFKISEQERKGAKTTGKKKKTCL